MTDPTQAEIEVATQAIRTEAEKSGGDLYGRCARAALTAAAQERERASQENVIIGALGTIANLEDEDDEWDGTDKFHDAREMARTAMAHVQRPALMPIYSATEDQGEDVLGTRKDD